MAGTPAACWRVTVGLGVTMLGLAACTHTPREPLEPPPGFGERPSARSDAAEQVETLSARRDLYDEDGDGFVSPDEAEGYYRRNFAALDDDNDGRLTRAELKPETPATPELELAIEELVGRTEQEYVDDNLREHDLRADRTLGMMSTRDFDEMVGGAISTPRPELLP
jgi:EF hand